MKCGNTYTYAAGNAYTYAAGKICPFCLPSDAQSEREEIVRKLIESYELKSGRKAIIINLTNLSWDWLRSAYPSGLLSPETTFIHGVSFKIDHDWQSFWMYVDSNVRK